MSQFEGSSEEPVSGLSEEEQQKLQIPEKLPVLLLRDVVVFPYMIAPLYVGREKSKGGY